ncbi:uncharacterized protein LOC144033826 [Festucalex cinctus]
MYTLRTKSAAKISNLLDEYEKKHGPVVGEQATAKGKKALPTRPEETYYSEEEEIACVYRTPVRSDLPENDGQLYMSAGPEWTESEVQDECSDSDSVCPYTWLRECPSLLPGWEQMMFFLIAALFLYLVISNSSKIYASVILNAHSIFLN